MSHRSFARAAGVVFAFVFIVHLLRLVLGWEAVIGGVVIPMWVSGLGLIIAGILGYYGFRHQRQ
ncbi:MAG: hypothetical protein HYU81_00940 [Candidatus Brennerbacteria bacterium]|nr:hypothetical protein [Candidatus Brennerbacteria bacterium]